jgi:hypothetical protein
MVQNQFSRPAEGSYITVVTDHSSHMPGYASYVPRQRTKTGKVVKSERWMGPDEFCLETGDPRYPVSVINLRYVVDIRDPEGEQGEVRLVEQPDFRSFRIPSSKGDEYTVTKRGEQWGCECKGFQFRGACKHIKQAKEQLTEAFAS